MKGGGKLATKGIRGIHSTQRLVCAAYRTHWQVAAGFHGWGRCKTVSENVLGHKNTNMAQ